jgi:hypothetical protein
MATDIGPTARRRSRLNAEAQLLAQRYGSVTFDQEDATWVHIPGFPLPAGWSRAEVEILIDVPYGNPGYPTVAPEWFWTDRDLRTSDGGPISHFFASSNNNFADQAYVNKGWGHFCVHLAGEWHPASGLKIRQGHNLGSYLELIATIFRDRQTLAGR